MSARSTADLAVRRILAPARSTGRTPSEPDAFGTASPELARWSDYFAVVAAPRFRATQRGQLGDAARAAMLLVVAVALFNCGWQLPFHTDTTELLVGVNALTSVVAAAGYVWLRSRRRRHPDVVVYVVLATVDIATVALGVYSPAFGLMAAGYLLLLPTIVALMVPWSTRHHAWWLVIHAAFILAYGALATGAALPGWREEEVALVLMACGISALGHIIALRARIRAFVQIEYIRALNRQGRRNAQRLDHLNEVLEVTARTDELTGLKNRLSLRLDLRAVRGRITRHRERYGLLVLDLDRFKAVNDSLGHVAGDRALRAVAQVLISAVRAEDGAYRYGGEEFVVVLEVAHPDEGILAAERIRRIVEDLDLPNPGNPPSGHLTVSVGVTIVGPDDLVDDDDTWFSRADAAMYRAKAGGRNRCESGVGAVGAPEASLASAPHQAQTTSGRTVTA
jgi:diguanylate cyclase (GGDEF)-like protein